MRTAANTFQSIPLDFREQFYSDVRASVLYFPAAAPPPPPVSAPPGASLGASGKPPAAYSRSVCVALLLRFDALEVLENSLAALEQVGRSSMICFSLSLKCVWPSLMCVRQVNVTRAVSSFACSVNLSQTVVQMYEQSTQFESFRDKLWGPQEEELGASPTSLCSRMFACYVYSVHWVLVCVCVTVCDCV